MSQVASLRRLV